MTLRTRADQAPVAPAVPRVGFFTDTSICIGCKACEVACKEWNMIPGRESEFTGQSYDNTGALGADSWRHVAFIEQRIPAATASVSPDALADVVAAADGLRWLMSSDVCKHCTTAACLDVCPTGSLFRTEFGTVVVQEDICNGCGYCVPACPFGVIDRRESDGRVWKCTMCYDRLRDDLTPACAQACPTQSIQFGPLDELRARAAGRVETLHRSGVTDARLYGADDLDGVDGAGAFFLLLDEPQVYGLPPHPIAATKQAGSSWRAAAGAAAALIVAVGAAMFGRRP